MPYEVAQTLDVIIHRTRKALAVVDHTVKICYKVSLLVGMAAGFGRRTLVDIFQGNSFQGPEIGVFRLEVDILDYCLKFQTLYLQFGLVLL
jgi:hypothetical protein